jgi:nucleoid-associated protein YgaU
MDSKMKVGVIVTLLVIFIILFAIGRWPLLQSESEEGERAQTLMSSQADPPGLAGRERHAQQYMEKFQRAAEEELTANNGQIQQYENSDINAEVRIILPLPKTYGPVTQPAEVVQAQDQNPQILPEPAWPKAYVVESGDSLALIAKHFYGSVEGNRIDTIGRLFAANRPVLRTPDQLRVGQKLVIPPLSPLASKALEAVTVRVKNIGEVRSNQRQTTQSRRPFQDQWYVVRDGDSLWKIASSKLGNASLYLKIAKLNSAVIEDEDRLPVGLRLRLPVL